jgi:GNAT superfamily N-acetyltransferase
MPTFFADHELNEFSDDLNAREKMAFPERWPYFVLVTNDLVRACGGYAVNKQQEATLIWGMVHRDEHRQGLGSHLLKHRIGHMKGKASCVLLDTTPESFKIY